MFSEIFPTLSFRPQRKGPLAIQDAKPTLSISRISDISEAVALPQSFATKTDGLPSTGGNMNRIFFGAVFCALATIATTAHAQSSVQLYGIVDDALTYVSNQGGSHAWAQFSGVGQSDRWGLRGTEDLGSGNRAIFRLENGFTINNGQLAQGGLEFGRQAFVGLESDRLGSLTLGRQYDFMTVYLTEFSAGTLTPSVFAFHVGDLDRLGGERINNAVKYQTPEFHGLRLGALYSFGGQAGNFSANSAEAFGLQYALGDLHLAAAYVAMHNYVQTFGIGTSVLGNSLHSSAPLGVLLKPQTFDKVTVAGFGAGYRLGPAYFHGLFTLVDFQRKGESDVLRTAEGGAKYYVTYAWSLAASYAYSKLGENHWNQVAIGADYAFSKRTDIYLNAVYLHAGAGTMAELYLLPQSSTNTQTVVSLGMRHLF
ncbi:porin [Trinickia terrae]|uniref:Porin n=1 Tax=Trinickia terrae TaxID=2571161 RepID=A0A4U1HYC3_9BURK|nr:porin [Trinickia terrae]TKC85903.1 porin [Trinickia terrae]